MARLGGNLRALRADPVKHVSAFADVAYTIKRGRIIYRAERK